jgi:hypothetical protein
MISFTSILLTIGTLSSLCSGFSPIATTSSLAASALAQSSARASTFQLNAYVPSGLSPEEYRKIQENDRKMMGKDLGRVGPRGFKSRSMQAWQQAYERGEATHAIAPFGYRELLKEGKISKKDVPYMVRGGSWDNSDVQGAKRLKWLKTDREYANGGYKKEQSVSILGNGPGFNWTGEKRDADKNQKWLVPGLS